MPDTGKARSTRRPASVVVTAPVDDEISVDDPDIEGSELVGAPVIEQMLGGRVIEEREE
jgi:DNA polymerase-3 subunit gamma/tau